MADSLFLVGEAFGRNFVDGLSDHWAPVTGPMGGAASAEERVAMPIREAGVFSNLYIYVKANTITDTTVITLRKSVADTALTVSYTSGETGIKEDTSNSVSFAATDEAAYKVDVPSVVGTTNINFTMFGMKFTPTDTSKSVNVFPAISLSGSFAANETNYRPPVNATSMTATEANAKYRVRASFTSSNLFVFVLSNSRTTDMTFKTRVNGANGNQSVTYTSGETGVKEDTSNTDSLVAGDDYNYSVITGNSAEAMTVNTTCTQLTGTASKFPLLAGRIGGASNNFNVTRYIPVHGELSGPFIEADAQIYPRFTFTAKELGAYVTVNTIATSPTTFTVRDNGADSAVVISYAAGETGLKNDSSNTAVITSGTDEVSYKIATPNTSGAITYTWIGMIGETASASNWVTNLSDSVTLADVVVKKPVKTSSDTVALTDNKIQTLIKSIADSLGITDSMLAAILLQINLSDNQTIADALIKTQVKQLSDMVAVSDSPQKIAARILTETIAITDTLRKTITFNKADSVTISDISSQSTLILIQLLDSLAIADSKKLIIGKNIVDILTLADTLAKSLGLRKLDSLVIVDALAKVMVKTPADSMAIIDVVNKLIIKSPSDILTISDGFLRSITKALSDNITLLDAINITGGSVPAARRIYIAVPDKIKRRRDTYSSK